MKTKSTPIVALLMVAVLAIGLTACGSRGEDAVYVQSVASLNGMGSLGFTDRFAGVAQAGKTVELRLDSEMKLDELRVEEGQAVNAGDVLFTYNNEAAALRVEQAKLDLEQLKNEITALRSQIEDLAQERNMVSSDQKLSYTLEIQSKEADIRETQYNISIKEQELKQLEQTVSQTQIKSTVTGRVAEINLNGAEYGDDGSERPFMTVVETGSLRVKGFINELNRGMLTEGQTVTVRDRMEPARTWQGTIQTIDWENAEQGDQSMKMMGYYGDEDEMTTSSRYPFYITLENSEGLLIGQHVYIEPGAAGEDSDDLCLPAAFVEETEDGLFVWAASAGDKLEKREIETSDYDEETGLYTIESGLTAEDFVAFPDGTLQEGMPVIRTDENILEQTADDMVFEGAEVLQDDETDEKEDQADDTEKKEASASEAGSPDEEASENGEAEEKPAEEKAEPSSSNEG